MMGMMDFSNSVSDVENVRKDDIEVNEDERNVV